MTRLRAAVFNRESKGKGTSIDDQERENLAACEELGGEVAVTLRDVVGASRFTTKRRVGWPEVTDLVQSGLIDLLVVWEVARADRTMDSWVPFVSACGRQGVRLHVTSLETTYDPRKAAHRKALLDMGSTAEAETGQLSERARKGVRGAALSGKAHGRSAFGYTREYGPIVSGKRTFTEVHNEDIGVAVEIITAVSKRVSLTSIAKLLNERPAGERGRRSWTYKAIKYLVRNPAYVGKRRHVTSEERLRGERTGQLHEGNWPPASDDPEWEATWLRANSVLSEDDRRYSGPGNKARNLLTYSMRCAHCEGPDGKPSSMTAERRENRGRRYRCYGNGCSTIAADAADEYVTRLVLSRLSQPDARSVFGRRGAELATVEAEVLQLGRKLEEARQAYEDDVISAEALGRKEKRLVSELEKAQRRADDVRRLDAVTDFLGEGEFSESVGRRRWNELTMVQRRALLKGLFSRIELQKTEVRLTRFATEDERLALATQRIVVRWRGSGSTAGAAAQLHVQERRQVDDHAQPATGR